MGVFKSCSCDVPVLDSYPACEEVPRMDPFELLHRSIELHLQYNPHLEFYRMEYTEENGGWTATPVYRDKRIIFPQDD